MGGRNTGIRAQPLRPSATSRRQRQSPNLHCQAQRGPDAQSQLLVGLEIEPRWRPPPTCKTQTTPRRRARPMVDANLQTGRRSQILRSRSPLPQLTTVASETTQPKPDSRRATCRLWRVRSGMCRADKHKIAGDKQDGAKQRPQKQPLVNSRIDAIVHPV
jgi:hypothetical protein